MGLRFRWTWFALLVAAACLWSLLLPAVLWAIQLPKLAADEMAIVHLDVGQGMATLIIGPETALDQTDSRVTVLVDAGRLPSTKDKDGGQAVLDALRACGQKYGTKRLDYFILTHYDDDHYGGAVSGTQGGKGFMCAEDGQPATGDDIPIGTFIDHGDETTKPANRDSYSAAVDAMIAAQQSGERRHVSDGASLDEVEVVLQNEGDTPVEMTCVAGNRYVWGADERVKENSNTSMAENDMSLGYLLSYGGFDYLICGDAGNLVEEAVVECLAAGEEDAKVDVLNVSHHGSSGSTSTTFLNVVQPEVAVISVGGPGTKAAGYQHPSYKTLSRLNAKPYKESKKATCQPVQAMYQTGEGCTVVPEGKKLPSTLKRSCKDITIVTDGVSYRISYFDAGKGQYKSAGPFTVDGPSPVWE